MEAWEGTNWLSMKFCVSAGVWICSWLMGYFWGVDAAVVVAAACDRSEALSCLEGIAVKFRYDSLWRVAIIGRGPDARAARAETVVESMLREAILKQVASRAQLLQRYWNKYYKFTLTRCKAITNHTNTKTAGLKYRLRKCAGPKASRASPNDYRRR